MTRRFTETEKWADPWFRALQPQHKLAWMYLVDNCDVAGFLDLDQLLANFQIGFEVDWERFIHECERQGSTRGMGVVSYGCGFPTSRTQTVVSRSHGC